MKNAIFVILAMIYLLASSFMKEETKIEGYVNKVLDTGIEIKTANNSTYFIPKIESDIKENDSILITYDGIWNKNRYEQEITIKNMKKIELKKEDGRWNDGGIFQGSYEKAYQKLLTMSEEEKIGQLLLARVPSKNQEEIMRQYQFGGIVLFYPDFEGKTKDEVKNMIKRYQSVSTIPMITATDEEGGSVIRVSKNPLLSSEPFLSPSALYQKGGWEAIQEETIQKSNLLLELGINLNLAPVADISTSPNDYIYKRTLGLGSKETATYVKTVVSSAHKTNISSCLKHFPGYGANLDTHTGSSIDHRPFEQFLKSDFIPFQTGIEAGVEVVMVSHNTIASMDEKHPASLSVSVHNVLRNELHFTGLIITDDLAMNATSKDIKTSPNVAAIKAGNDMLIVTDYETCFEEIKNALKNGVITEQEINQAVVRILAFKYYKGILS